ncbi:hypothetical protein BJ878DRAFT_496004 [Calycina marina]|uniref:RING-type domain-containing protein n=1 Tax=Calycina marina TaxID=1763456 RepID=A0A9P8CGX1_9HELO|nr:hypothetical protein BJ878DRAFT_496004 [Calycina marina]
MSHSKRNTSRAIFTSYERSLAKAAWGSNSARLSRDSFLPFASCKLCLMPARDPVSCSYGDLFCRECALNNILSQKKEIKRLEKSREQELQESNENRDQEDNEVKDRSVQDFEKIQIGLEVDIGGAGNKIVGREDGKIVVEEEVAGGKKGEKRKFELDENELLRIALEERTKARKIIDQEKASKTTLPSFWVPSITPSSNTATTLHNVTKQAKLSPICPSSPPDKPHCYSLHGLVTVQFTEEKDAASKTNPRICPACKKALSNTSKAMLAKPCGHVLCKNCVTRFMTPTGIQDAHAPDIDHNAVNCFVCQIDLTEKKAKGKQGGKSGKDKITPGLVEIKSEGTGFASGGQNKVEKSGVAFQC